jgi:hypothetical protein
MRALFFGTSCGLLLTIALSGLGCGSAPDARLSFPLHSHATLTGPLAVHLDTQEALRKSSAYGDACDRSLVEAEKRRVLVAALDQRAEKIQRFAQSRPVTEEGLRRLKLGPTTVRAPVNASREPDAWVSTNRSWSQQHLYYQRIKHLDVGAEWANLSVQVQALLLDDGRRLAGLNMQLDRHSGPILETTAQALKLCLERPNCVAPAFSPEQKEFLKANAYYRPFWDRIGKDDARTHLQGLADWIEADLNKGYRLFKNPTISRPSQAELRVPLVAGRFEGAESQFAHWVESVWRSPKLAIKIDWTQPTIMPEAFRLLLGDTIGGRAFVQLKERTVNLFRDLHVRTLAHEFGHVLGILDRYYTTWRPENCSYQIENNAGDLMSASQSGELTADDWAELERHYPFNQ